MLSLPGVLTIYMKKKKTGVLVGQSNGSRHAVLNVLYLIMGYWFG